MEVECPRARLREGGRRDENAPSARTLGDPWGPLARPAPPRPFPCNDQFAALRVRARKAGKLVIPMDVPAVGGPENGPGRPGRHPEKVPRGHPYAVIDLDPTTALVLRFTLRFALDS